MNELERIRDLNTGQPGPRPEARSAARAALVSRFDALEAATAKPAPRRLFRTRNIAIGAASGLAAVAILIGLGSGGGSSVHPEIANAAELNEFAELAPHLEIAGGWQITHTEASPEGGATQFHYERDFPDSRTPPDAEIRWHSASVDEVGQQLEAEGFAAAGTQPTSIISGPAERADEPEHFFTRGTANVYAAAKGADGLFEAAGVLRQDDWTLDVRARIDDLYTLERLLERVELLGREEWLIALRPGGGKWLNDTMNGSVKKIEKVKSELPDGTVVYTVHSYGKSPDESGPKFFTAAFPVIYRDGDNVRVEVEEVPDPVSEAP